MQSEQYRYAEIIKEGIQNYFPYSSFFRSVLSKAEISIINKRIASYFFIKNLVPYLNSIVLLPIAEILIKNNQEIKSHQIKYRLNNSISSHALREIDNIIHQLYIGGLSNKQDEISRIRKVCRTGESISIAAANVDLFLQKSSGEVILIDIRSSTPNFANFVHYKKTILYWIAIWLYQYPEADINSFIAIPYNPYAPAPYERWTMKGMLDIEKELLVAEEFWDFVAGEKVYEDLLDCFERVGMRLCPEIDKYCQRLGN
jgi:hypothetical protein